MGAQTLPDESNFQDISGIDSHEEDTAPTEPSPDADSLLEDEVENKFDLEIADLALTITTLRLIISKQRAFESHLQAELQRIEIKESDK